MNKTYKNLQTGLPKSYLGICYLGKDLDKIPKQISKFYIILESIKREDDVIYCLSLGNSCVERSAPDNYTRATCVGWKYG